MDLTHRFSVPASADEAWTAFANLERLAPCFPGATITSIDGDDFAGSVKIKLGPIALVYTGTGRYVAKDAGSRKLVIEARGKDKRGNGTATAIVSAAFLQSGEQTDVEVTTDLSITGKPAQFGRGVISDVSDKLLDQFVSCVSGRFAEGLGEPEPVVDPGNPGDPDQTVELGAVPEELDAPGAGTVPPPGLEAPVGDDFAAPTPIPSRPRPAPPRRAGDTPPADTARTDLNIVSTVLPVLVKRYWPVLGGAALAAFVFAQIVKRSKR